MKEKIIEASIESLKKEGLRFSVDTLAEKLKISKKTIYKFFPDKETLALALYETYYARTVCEIQRVIETNALSCCQELLYLYFDAKAMTRNDIFNKYKLNQRICAYTTEQNDKLWMMMKASFKGETTKDEEMALRIIVDGAFEKLCKDGLNPEDVIKRLVKLL